MIHQVLNRFATHVRTIIAPDDNDATIDDSRIIYQQVDARILIELFGLGMPGIELMIT